MAQVHGNAASTAAAPGERAGLGRLIGAGLILVSLVLLALGAYLGPYTQATSTPGKLTVQNCTVDYKYRSRSSSSRKRTKTKWCYGTFAADNGTAKDLNAELKTHSVYPRGHVIDARKTGDTSYELDQSWTAAIATGCAWWFGALIPLALGLFFTATGFAFGGPSDVHRSRQTASQGLLRTVYILATTGLIGCILSILVSFIA
ncbi:hypothetical protein ACIHAA_16330 [Streptomyces sp. NPDC052040]|uniref:hypothetical protein n=1 Tax=unclassified Streptomyces TaxID=2593676 RepID=UPI0037CF8841